MPYIDPEILSDEGATAEAMLAALADQIPGWEPSEGHVETSLVEAEAMVIVAAVVLLKAEAGSAFLGFAERILGLVRKAEGVATALSDWTMLDAAGYLIPDGTQLFMRAPDGSLVGFATIGDTTVPPGDTVALGVRVTALEAGPQANGFLGSAAAVDTVVGVTGAALSTLSTGGADAESLDDFRDRSADRARRLRAVPITADDYAALALDLPSVARAMVVNLLDPDNPPGPGEAPEAGGHLTVFPIDVNGEPVSAGEAEDLAAMLTGDERPLNVAVHVAAPTYATIPVALTVRLDPGADPDAMEEAIAAAVSAYLSPARWGLDDDEPGRWHAPENTGERTVSRFDVAYVVRLVPGVLAVDACTVAGGASVVMNGYAPLPRPGAITVTVAP